MDRANEVWIEELRQQGARREAVLVDLRASLFRGLRAALAGRAGVHDAFLEDAVQEALLKVLARLDTFAGRGRFLSWAMAIAVREALTGPLAVAFRKPERPEDGRVAASILADYVAERPEVLADLLADADPKQYATLWPRLEAQRERAVPLLHDELAKTAAFDWQDAPLDPAWAAPAPALVRQVEAAQKEVERAHAHTEAQRQRQRDFQARPRPPGRAPDFACAIGLAEDVERQAAAARQQCQDRQEQARQAVRGVADDYHPFDGTSGRRPDQGAERPGRTGQNVEGPVFPLIGRQQPHQPGADGGGDGAVANGRGRPEGRRTSGRGEDEHHGFRRPRFADRDHGAGGAGLAEGQSCKDSSKDLTRDEIWMNRHRA